MHPLLRKILDPPLRLVYSGKCTWLIQLVNGPRGGGGGLLPSISYIGNVPPHRVGFLCRFGLKTGIHFAHFGLESGMVLRDYGSV